MNEFLNTLVSLISTFGYPVIVGAILIGSLGIPIPLEGVLIIAGFLSALGYFNLYTLIFLLTLVTILGDSMIYLAARTLGPNFISRCGKFFRIKTDDLTKLHNFLEKWGFGAVFITRWFLTPFGLPINILAGITKYSYSKFLLASFLGEILWVSIYVYLGYFFSNNLILLLQQTNYLSTSVLLISISTIFGYILYRKYKY